MSISVQFGRSPGNQVVLDGHGNTCNFISFIIQAFRGYHLSSNSSTEPSQESGDWYFRGICLEDEIAYVSISKIRKPLTLKPVCHLHHSSLSLNVILTSAKAHILKMNGPERPSRGLIIHYFMLHLHQVPAQFYFRAPFTCGYHWTMSLSVLPCHRLCWDPTGLILLLVREKPELQLCSQRSGFKWSGCHFWQF